MNTFTVRDLENLAREHDNWCVSIYMPTIEKSQEVRQNPTRFKNLVNQAEEALQQAGMERTEASDMLRQAENLVQDGDFWQFQNQGLAVFIASDEFHTFQLPQEVPELVIVNSRFYLKPLMPLLHGGDQFYILALSQGDVRLLKATQYEVEALEVPGLPKNMDEALGYDNLEKQLQWHTNTAPRAGSKERPAMYHGHGEGDDKLEEYQLHFFRGVNKAVADYLKDSQDPLVLASVEEAHATYKQANTYKHLAEEVVPGNPEAVRDEELRDKAWESIQHVFKGNKEEIKERYKILSGRNDKLAVKDVAEIIKAAPFGRVEVLFLDKNASTWGRFHTQSLEVEFDETFEPGRNHDLLDFAAAQTLLNGGTVFAMEPEEIPEEGSPAAAILRY